MRFRCFRKLFPFRPCLEHFERCSDEPEINWIVLLIGKHFRPHFTPCNFKTMSMWKNEVDDFSSREFTNMTESLVTFWEISCKCSFKMREQFRINEQMITWCNLRAASWSPISWNTIPKLEQARPSDTRSWNIIYKSFLLLWHINVF